MAKILRFRLNTLKIFVLMVLVGALLLVIRVYRNRQQITVSDNETMIVQSSISSHELHIYLAIVILSDPIKESTRNAIRETWLSVQPNTVKHWFVVGSKGLNQDIINNLKEEHKKYQDIMFLNTIKDGYDSLTSKTLQTFTTVHKTLNFDFLLKCDDDSFVRIQPLVKELSKQPQKKLYWGFFKGGSSVFQKGKWKERNWFLCDTYLPYALGGGYVISSDLVKYLSDNSQLLQQYKSEDVSVGLWLSPLKIYRVHDVRFDTEFQSRGCFNSYLITHKQSVKQMKEKQDSILKTGNLCTSEKRIRYSYNYNWSVLPSKCCKNFDVELP